MTNRNVKRLCSVPAVVAEGIEHAEQAAALRALGCDLGQGFHFAGPLDADALAAFLRGASTVAAGKRG
jgi:EAL domain-containing protein (putative c-di-GMP-specific phosphodiesterase class I)